MKRLLLLTLVLLSIGVLYPAQALAGRYVLNQTPETLQQYFGRPWTILTTKTQPLTKIYTYSPAGIRKVFPDFPKAGQFGVIFVDHRAETIWLDPNLTDEASYSYDPKKFFTYVFNYEPPIWKDLQYPGGHEGFAVYRGCFGDGIVAAYMESSLGTSNVSLKYDKICEPPYDRIPAPSFP
jgi:hypothetical protein